MIQKHMRHLQNVIFSQCIYILSLYFELLIQFHVFARYIQIDSFFTKFIKYIFGQLFTVANEMIY